MDKTLALHQRDTPDALRLFSVTNQVLYMHFMSGTLIDSCSIRKVNAIDGYNREGFGIEVDLSSRDVLSRCKTSSNGGFNYRQ